MASKIYLIECEGEKYYVGKTNMITRRVLEHFTGNGSKWTKLHKPIKVISILDSDDIFAEEKHTYLAMDKYGIENVRGGSYSTIKLSENDKKKISEVIHSMKDECYKCGEKGHFVNKCPINNPEKNIVIHPINNPEKNIVIHHIPSSIIIGEKANGGHVSHKKYNDFCVKCKGDCIKCNNTRICYQYTDSENEYIYTSCMHCYNGDDWGNDMFVVIDNTNTIINTKRYHNNQEETIHTILWNFLTNCSSEIPYTFKK